VVGDAARGQRVHHLVGLLDQVGISVSRVCSRSQGQPSGPAAAA
jgi:hypothetical protein